VSVPADAVSIAVGSGRRGITSGAERRDRPDEVISACRARFPFACWQATLSQVDGTFTVPVAAPADALPESGVKRGGLNVGLRPRLSGALPGLRRYFETYPYSCLEQMASKAIGCAMGRSGRR
jgi:uncharacterized protein YfaS (alpha-2-macroglobulin family)